MHMHRFPSARWDARALFSYDRIIWADIQHRDMRLQVIRDEQSCLLLLNIGRCCAASSRSNCPSESRPHDGARVPRTGSSSAARAPSIPESVSAHMSHWNATFAARVRSLRHQSEQSCHYSSLWARRGGCVTESLFKGGAGGYKWAPSSHCQPAIPHITMNGPQPGWHHCVCW